MQGVMLLPGFFLALFVLLIGLEYPPQFRSGRASTILSQSKDAVEKDVDPLRRLLGWLEKPLSRLIRPGVLRRTAFDLYWAQQSGHWQGWTASELVSLRLLVAIAGLLIGLGVLQSLGFGFAMAFLGFQTLSSLLRSPARKTIRAFGGQLAEYLQLTSAQMAAGVSMEEAFRRTARTESLPARWMRQVLQMSQGRSWLGQLKREAEQSQLPELNSLAVQLGFIQRGTAQEQLMEQLSAQLAADAIAEAEKRAEKIGAELVIPMVLFYFLPFLISLMAVIAWPVIQGLL
jgi:Flp pilus assembly protein TadB